MSCLRRLVKIGAKVASHGRYVGFHMAEVAVGAAVYPIWIHELTAPA